MLEAAPFRDVSQGDIARADENKGAFDPTREDEFPNRLIHGFAKPFLKKRA